MKRIYIVLSYTGSLPSQLIKFATKKHYTHVSLSLNKELTQMYSFGRKYLRFPVPGGFVKEDVTQGLYAREKACIVVQEISVNEEQYNKLINILSSFQGNSVYYDYKGAIGIYFNKDLFGEYGYVCSSFVNQVLNMIGIKTKKNNWEIEPEDFLYLENTLLIYEGNASNYCKGVHKKCKSS